MTLQSSWETDDTAEPEPTPNLTAVPAVPERPRWWKRPWIVPLGFLAAAFLAMSLPAYVGLDRELSRVTLRDDFPLHYPMVLGHILFGTIALVTVVLQVWPRLRERRPAVHRRVGRVYVFAGVIPTALLALVLTPVSHGPAGNGVAAVLWLGATIAGYVAIRQGRRADHRRWMVYSFAITMQIVWGRVLFVTLSLIPAYDAEDPNNQALAFETASWIGFVINLLIASWWLRRTERRESHPVAA